MHDRLSDLDTKRLVVRVMFISLVESGRLTIRDRSIEEIFADYREIVSDLRESLDESEEVGNGVTPDVMTFTTDHREMILENARAALSAGRLELACMLFGTYCEHHINLLVSSSMEQLGYSEKTIVTLIRTSNLAVKVTALWEVADLPEWDEEALKQLNILTEVRNGFVHYKWKGMSDAEHSLRNERPNRALAGIETLLSFLKGVEDEIYWNGRKEELVEAVFRLAWPGEFAET
ncbi:hypothetical protein [Nocardia tengchongensis]